MPLGWHSASKKHKITLRLKTSVKIADIMPLHKKNEGGKMNGTLAPKSLPIPPNLLAQPVVSGAGKGSPTPPPPLPGFSRLSIVQEGVGCCMWARVLH